MIMPLPSEHRDRRSVVISVVLPVFNEVAILNELTRQIVEVMQDEFLQFEIVYVNDGSKDGSREQLNADSRLLMIESSSCIFLETSGISRPFRRGLSIVPAMLSS